MLTKIDICSMALLKLGENPIQSLADNTAAAQLSRTLFRPIMDGLIASHPWRFACQRFTLNKTADGDFLVPGDVLRIIKCDGQIVGDRILAQSDKLDLLAIVRVPVDKYPEYFISLAATKLAMEFCIPLTGDQTVFRMLVSLYESELKSAKFIDSTTAPSANIDAFTLVNVRF